MRVVWQPDSESVYLSSGQDNLALHQIPEADLKDFQPLRGQLLDHFGFLMASPEAVDREFEQIGSLLKEYGGSLVKPPKRHRDDSYSFYIADPDNNRIQILYEPIICQGQKAALSQDRDGTDHT